MSNPRLPPLPDIRSFADYAAVLRVIDRMREQDLDADEAAYLDAMTARADEYTRLPVVYEFQAGPVCEYDPDMFVRNSPGRYVIVTE